MATTGGPSFRGAGGGRRAGQGRGQRPGINELEESKIKINKNRKGGKNRQPRRGEERSLGQNFRASRKAADLHGKAWRGGGGAGTPRPDPAPRKRKRIDQRALPAGVGRAERNRTLGLTNGSGPAWLPAPAFVSGGAGGLLGGQSPGSGGGRGRGDPAWGCLSRTPEHRRHFSKRRKNKTQHQPADPKPLQPPGGLVGKVGTGANPDSEQRGEIK